MPPNITRKKLTIRFKQTHIYYDSHIRYCHASRPSIIEIVCPNCQKQAFAEDKLANNRKIVVDLSPSWKTNPFTLRCPSCLYRKENISYFELPEYYHQIRGRSGVLWAWNLEHLEFIHRFLKGQPDNNKDYAFYETYIHGAWKQHNKAYAKAIEHWLISNQLSFEKNST
jgi:hypothetical protein